MACNWIRNTQGEIIGSLDENKQPSQLFKNLENEYGLEEAIDYYSVAKSDLFSEASISKQEPTLNNLMQFIVAQNQNKNKLTPQQKVDYCNLVLEVGEIDTNLFYDEKGMFIIDESKLKSIYTPLEIRRIQNDASVYQNVKSAVEALKNEEDLEVELPQVNIVERSAKISLFGKQEIVNPFIATKEIISGKATEENYPKTYQTLQEQGILDTYVDAQVMQEDENGDIVEVIDNNTEDLISLKKVEDNQELEDDLLTLFNLRSDVIDQNEDKVKILLDSVEQAFVNQGLDVVGLSEKPINKSFLNAALDFQRNPSKENTEYFISQYTILFEKSIELKVEKIIGDKNKQYILLETSKTEQELFLEQNLIKETDGKYLKVQDQTLDDLYANMATYTDKYPSDMLLQEYVQQELPKANNKQFTNTEVAEKVFLYKMFYGISEQEKTNKQEAATSNFTNVKESFVSDFWQKAVKEKYKNSKMWNDFYKHFDINKNGLYLKNTDPLTLLNIKQYANEDLNQYSLMSRQMPNLITPEITQINERDNFVNNPQLLEPFTSNVFKTKDGDLIVRNSKENFIKIGERVFEKTDELENIAVYAPLTQTDKNFALKDVKSPQTKTEIKEYRYLTTMPEAFTSVKNYLVKQKKQEINQKEFDC